jgi:HlyD family secretion protein
VRRFPRLPRSLRGGRAIAAGGVVALLVGGFFARTTFASNTTSDGFRTAVVTRASVTQTLERTGTIEPISQAAVTFPIAGTVSTVSVQVGQPVNTGDQLAALDTTSLKSQLAQKQATLAQAELTLRNAVTAANAASTTTTTSAARGAASSGQPSSVASTTQQVNDDQARVDAALTKAQGSLQAADDACSSSWSTGTTTSTTSSTSSTTSSTTSTTQPSPSSAACSSAQRDAQADQQAVAKAEQTLAGDEAKLAKALAAASASSAGAGGSSSSTKTAAPSPSLTVTPAQLIADQAAVDAAQADVNVVVQNLAEAAVVSPLVGTVASVTLIPGAAVSAGSASANVVVVGQGGYEVTTNVAVADITKVKLGDAALVEPDGTTERLDGKVVAIGLVPTSSGTSTTYPITVGLSGAPVGLRNGATAAVGLQVARADSVVTVPTSAVRVARTIHIVTVLVNGKATGTPVQVGTIGVERTEITSGLEVGQTIVLADLAQPIPASNTNQGQGAGGLGGGTIRVQRGD